MSVPQFQCGTCDGWLPPVAARFSPGSRCNCSDEPLYHRAPFNPAAFGYHATYRDGERNHCPGCGREHWFVGRTTAECAFCGTALPLRETSHGGASATVVGWSTRPGVGPLEC